MPKLVNSVPAYRRHKASGQAIVTLCGKDFYLGPHGSKVSRDLCDRLTAEWLVNGRRLPSDDRTTVTLEELLAAFWEHAQAYYVGLDGLPTTELDSYRQAMKPLRALYASSGVEDFALRDMSQDSGRTWDVLAVVPTARLIYIPVGVNIACRVYMRR